MSTRLVRPARPVLLKQLVRTVRERELFLPGQHLLVAVSGGADSIALLALLVRLVPTWRLTLTAVHVNYRLRGAESDDDEAFVSAFCQERHIPLTVLRPDLVRQRRRSSLQSLARDARYDAMKRLARKISADRIVVGHTANDQAETILMWMLRGAGLTGLAGMPFIRESIIVRPLLSSTREEIREFLEQEGLPFREDSSNRTDRYRRNRIRKELMPVVIRIAPAAIGLLQRQADLLREDEHYLERTVREQWSALVRQDTGKQCIDRPKFLALPTALQRRLLRMMLRHYEPDGSAPSIQVVEAARRLFVTGTPGAAVSLRHVTIRREGSLLCLVQRKEHDPAVPTASSHKELCIAIPSTVHWARTHTRFQVQLLTRQEAELLLRRPSKYQALFDADLISTPLLVRNWRPGDRIYPTGMKGKSKKLQDLFTDMKVTRGQRDTIPIWVAPEGLLWVTGIRHDARFLVRESTSRCLVITMIDRPKGEQ